MTRLWIATAGVAALALGACQAKQADEAPAGTATGTTTGSTSGVSRDVVAAPTPEPAPIQGAAIQSQPGPKGNTVSLNKVAVTGDILTVTMTYSGGDQCCVHIPVNQVSVIDDATSQRFSVLKDNAGQAMAAPLESNPASVMPDSFKQPSIVWFKFPAPPVTSATVSITVPGVAPFDAVPVTR